ncbi:MAG: haloacid dehalogenase [Armatimonadetes bacterium]|nr:haloacid dehalogenase [Armatimonadota bacterium]
MTWDEIVESIRPRIDQIHAAREGALSASRQVIQTSSKSIRHVHRRQYPEAEALLAQARELARVAREKSVDHPEVLYAGYLQDAEKEMVEAAAVVAMAQNRPLPSIDDLGVQVTSYLNGMGEAASEIRRFLLDEMRAGNIVEAERLLVSMETIYDDLITFDYPDGVTGGLRRTCDALRAVIERTRSDLTMSVMQRKLIDRLEQNGQ